MSWLWGSKDSSDSSSSSSYDYSSSGSSFSSDSTGYGSDSSNFSSSFNSGSSSFEDSSSSMGSTTGKDAEIQTFLAQEQQRAQLQSMVHQMNDTCWEKCMGYPESKLTSRTETCIVNCVERFIDSSLFLTNRFAQLLSKQAGGGSFS